MLSINIELCVSIMSSGNRQLATENQYLTKLVVILIGSCVNTEHLLGIGHHPLKASIQADSLWRLLLFGTLHAYVQYI
jgi:hypothetical protein